MKSVCLIPARGGSKRIIRKNIKTFFGQPLIAWSIKCAKSSGLFDTIYVSTDDYEIAEIARKYGAEIPFIRPKEISNDKAIDKDVREHFLEWCRKKNISLDVLCYLYPTAPFITTDTLKNCLELLFKKNVFEVFTISKFNNNPLKSLKINDDGSCTYNWPEFELKRSQDLKQSYYDAGQCYFFNLKIKNIESKRIGYEIPFMFSHDIDTPEDFEYAEMKFSFLVNKGLISL